jgi:hypothetical protein
MKKTSALCVLGVGMFALLGALATACDGGGGGGDGANQGNGGSSGATPASGSCASAGAKMCERACACGTDGKCKTGSQGTYGTTTLTWDDVEDCKGAYVGLACKGSGPPGVDFNACESAVVSADCADDVFVVPKICDPPKDGG